ncbi:MULTISPECIES: M20 family metallopeptidase [Mycobacteroides]|uniref:M20 family metallopeptidase n=1 Tax=Mycobacteroides TaxID=670516 RepID=UPI0008A980D2|nr:M20 family metallopeptidase [Mycobacteroides chelonae]MBV0919432.1 amidohydrolase [Mycobacteroides chelonae]OHU24942.1 amidohydrolase [Mycobacteroides chelonae]OHU63086.1 amidohydrolase [Mycobacteroides chelonae]GLE59284.1 putative amidohydrolase [Mycobacteroides chelonae]
MTITLPDNWADALGDLADFYRDLHQHPELSFQEHRTAAKIQEAIAPLGLEVTSGVGGTGVVAVLRNGSGPVVWLRADFDALPVQEQTGLPYASTVRATNPDGRDVPVMHACGHDMHVTALVGALRLLNELKTAWSGTVVAVFQPAEEVGGGAKAMIADGILDRFPKPEVVLGQHVGPLPAGMIAYKTGTALAASDSLKMQLFGRGGHGSQPESTVDPVVMASNVVQRLQTIVSRELSPFEPAVVTVGYLHAGAKDNIIPDDAELGINVRTFNEEVRRKTLASITRIAQAESTASGADKEPAVTPLHTFPITVVDNAAMQAIAAVFREHFGAARVIESPNPLAGSEDVGFFGTEAGVPTAFWFWGGYEQQRFEDAAAAGKPVPSNHSPEFAPVLEPTLSTGVEALTVAALSRLTATA